jgi:hypothetical protein
MGNYLRQMRPLITILALLFGTLCAAQVDGGASAEELWNGLIGEENRDDPALRLPVRNESLPNVLLFGDSISGDYSPYVAAALRGKVNLYRMPPGADWDSSTFLPHLTKLTATMAPAWRFKWDVIHFNFGLHDMKRYNALGEKDRTSGTMQVGYEDYARNLTTGIHWLNTNAPGAKLIFATTTPVPEGEPRRRSADSIRLNEIAREILVRFPAVAINDLYALTLPHHEKWMRRPHDVHYNPTGSQAQGEAVARAILQSLSL